MQEAFRFLLSTVRAGRGFYVWLALMMTTWTVFYVFSPRPMGAEETAGAAILFAALTVIGSALWRRLRGQHVVAAPATSNNSQPTESRGHDAA